MDAMDFLKKIFRGKQTKQESQMGQIVTAANKIVNHYGAFMRSSAFPAPFCVADTKKLPYEKQTIKEGFILLMRLCDDPKAKELLKVGYVSLANFQEGVSETDLGVDLRKLPNVKDIDFNDGNEVATVIKQTHAMIHSSDKFKEKVEKERLLLERGVSEI